jgi:serine/threonine protein kinase
MFRFVSQVDIPTPLSDVDMKWFVPPDVDVTIDIGDRKDNTESSIYIPHYDLSSDFEKVYQDFVQRYGVFVFERYEGQLFLLRQIARGAFGTIYNVKILTRPYAIKMEQRNSFLYTPDEFRTKLKTEFTFLKQVAKTGYAPRPFEYAFFQFKNEWFSFLTMELIPNSDMSGATFFRLKNAKTKSAIIVQKVFDFLNVLSSLRIVHGDLHWNNIHIQAPPNIRVSDLSEQTIQVKVLDFGMAFPMTSNTQYYDLYSLYISSVSNGFNVPEISRILKAKLVSLGLVSAQSTLPEIYTKFKQIKT